MFHSTLKALLFCSAMLVVVDASTVVAERALELEQPDEMSLLKRQVGVGAGAAAGVGAGAAAGVGLGAAAGVGLGAAAGAGAGAGVGLGAATGVGIGAAAGVGIGAAAGAGVGEDTGDVLVKAWTAVNAELSTCQTVVQQPSTSIEVAIQAVAKVSTLIQTASQSAQCSSCSDDKEIKDKLQTVLVTFFTKFQIILQACSKHYSDVWTVRFKDHFQQCSNGFTVIASICASLQIDLQAIISSAHLDISLFAAIGLDLSALLKVNLGLGH